MKLEKKSLQIEIIKNCDYFSQFTKTNIARFLAVEFSEDQEVAESSLVMQEQDVHFSILFNGMVYGEFILSMSKEVACKLIDEESIDFDSCKDDIFDSFKEILNMSVGKTMESLGQQFKCLTITSPRVTIGELHLPKLPVFTKELSSTLGVVSCSLYIDQMQQTLSKEYEANLEELNGAEEEQEKLKRLNKAKTEFLANMSHELRTPLNGMIGNLDLLKTTNLSSIQRRQINTVSQSGDFLLSIINDILEFSRIESGRLEVESRKFDLHQSLEGFADAIANQVYMKGLSFDVKIQRDIPTVIESDETRLKQVLMNLIGNAIKFTPSGKIELCVNVIDDSLEFKIMDTGVGIPENKVKSIFESFSQVDVSDVRKYGGSGLGLTISKSIVHALGGLITVESQEAVGTTFTFTIPLSNQAEFESKASPSSVASVILLESKAQKEAIEFYNDSKFLSMTRDQLIELSDSGLNVVLDCDAFHSLNDEQLDQLARLAKEYKWKLAIVGKADKIVSIDERIGILSEVKGMVIPAPLLASKWDSFLSDESLLQVIEDEESPQVAEGELVKAKGDFTVLLVEDNMINQQVAKAMIESFGLNVEVAGNGQEAVDKSSEKRFDLILMDCQMPVMDGYDATKAIREDGSNPNCNTKIIALTANAFREVKEKCFEYGMSDFATKPIKLEVMEALVKE